MSEARTGESLSGLTVGLFGHFDPDYTRNRILTKALRRAGASVVELRDVRRFPARVPRLARMAYAADPDVILVGFPSHSDVPLAKLVALARRRVVIYDAFTSVWEGNVVGRGRVRARSLAGYRYWLTDFLACSLADRILVDTEAHLDFFSEEFHVPARKFRRIWAGADDELMRPCESGSREDEFLVFFYGSFIPLHGVEHILEAAERLASEHPDVRFRLCGSGQTHAEMQRMASDRGLSNVEFLGRRPYPELRPLMCESAVCLGIFGTDAKAQRVIPNKAFDAFACGRPLVTADSPAVREALVHGEHAWLCPPGDGAALAEAIATLKADPALRERIAAGGHELFKRSFSLQALTDDVAELVREAATSGGRAGRSRR